MCQKTLDFYERSHLVLCQSWNDGLWGSEIIQVALDAVTATVERLRQQFVEDGFEACLRRKTRIYTQMLNGNQEAHLVAIAFSSPPTGQSRWTLRLLSERLVELGHVDSISHKTVRQTLKQMNLRDLQENNLPVK
jgi:hypothetical protein